MYRISIHRLALGLKMEDRYYKRSEVNYKSANYSQDRFCRACKFLDVPVSTCDRVDGHIDYGGVCDLFERDPTKKSLPPRNSKARAGQSS